MLIAFFESCHLHTLNTVCKLTVAVTSLHAIFLLFDLKIIALANVFVN